MKIAILSRAPNAYSTRRLKAAALERGAFRDALDDLWSYDPDTGWRQETVVPYDPLDSTVPQGHYLGGMASLGDGRIFVAGGYDGRLVSVGRTNVDRDPERGEDLLATRGCGSQDERRTSAHAPSSPSSIRARYRRR